MGPYVIANHLGRILYSDFLERTLPFYWKMQPFNVHESTWFQHNGTPSSIRFMSTVYLVQEPLSGHMDDGGGGLSSLHILLISTHLTSSYGDESKENLYTTEINVRDDLIYHII
jgi:hypothetical protein